MENQSQTFRIIGYTDFRNECDCCGKTDLKGTYVMADEFDNELYFGVTCGAKVAGISTKEFKAEATEIKKRVKLTDQLNDMINSATCQQHHNNIVKFIIKKKLDLYSFLTKYGKELENHLSFKVYEYGSNCFNVTPDKVYQSGKIVYQN